MRKKFLQDEIENELQSSDDEFYIDAPENDRLDSDNISEESDSSSGSDIIVTKRQGTIPLPSSSSNSAEDENITQPGNFGPWQDVTCHDQVPDRILFTSGDKMVGPQIPDTCTKPIDFFKLFFTDELIIQIVEQTNNYARHKIAQKRLSKRSTWHTWVDTTVEEFTAFLGVVLNMGPITVSNIQEYWSQQFNAKIPFFSSIFRRELCLQIFWMLHLHENDPNDQTLRARTQKVRQYLDYLDKQLKEQFVPSREISVDESVVRFKGKISFLTYNPKKPTKWGIRIYVMADANTGYVYSILPYYGSLTSEDLVRPDLPVTTRIVLHLCQKLLDNNPGYAVIARMAALDGLPFRVIITSKDLRKGLEARGFQNLPTFTSTIQNRILMYCEKVFDNFTAEVQCLREKGRRFSLTFDEWTSIANKRYININIHGYLDGQ
ncbi:piggyBac transposable element-derived protein 4-like [Onthophagus taurus]|uniref:piggyBac transposable element-derived protein 4-like n=1 Tax=Onthophagus taurus TaxID=166361 RepID=UPI0039BE489C